MSNKPETMHTLTPHIVVKGAAAAIEFYKKAFGAVELMRLNMPDSDLIMHAQVKIGDSSLMMVDEMDMQGCATLSPLKLGGSPVTLHLNVDNVDELFKQAVDAGAEALMPPADMFWGDRYGQVKDPFGHTWSIATHVRDVSPEELKAASVAGCAG